MNITVKFNSLMLFGQMDLFCKKETYKNISS
jgi:hypothetical protein